MIIQQKCPICEGYGNVHGGFYGTLPRYSRGFYSMLPGYSTSKVCLSETCRNCNGTGVVYVAQGEEEVIPPS